MSAAAIQILGDFDVAIARNVLRRKTAEYAWKPIFRARASAALTEAANLLLCAQTQGAIDISVSEKAGKRGIQLRCGFEWPNNRYAWLDEARRRLRHLVDELEISETPDGPRLTLWVWLRQTDTLV